MLSYSARYLLPGILAVIFNCIILTIEMLILPAIPEPSMFRDMAVSLATYVLFYLLLKWDRDLVIDSQSNKEI